MTLLVIHISNLISLWSKTYALYCHFISTFYFKKFGIHRMQVFAIAFLHAIFWPNIILTEKISRASKNLLYTINHHKLLNLNLKFLLLLMQCQYAKSRWVKNGKIVQYMYIFVKTNTSMAKRFFKEIHLKIALFWTI